MPIHDFRCADCGHVETNKYYTMPQYDKAHNRITPFPSCPACEADLGREIPMELFPQRMNNDLLGENFEVDLDGKMYKFSSLTEVRNLERDSEQRARNKEGNPYIFRKLSQDRGNYNKNTLEGSSLELARAQTPSRRTVRGQPIEASAITHPRD